MRTPSRSLAFLTFPPRSPTSLQPRKLPRRRPDLPLLPTTLSPLGITNLRTMASSAPPPPAGPLLKKPVKMACVQLGSGADKAANLARARDKVLEAARRGARIVVLPEIWNSPYGTDFFPKYAEPLLPSPPPRDAAPSFHALAAMAADAGVYLVGGSIPEVVVDDDSAGVRTHYNTALVFGPTGDLLATHRKTHLFDIDIPGKMTFRESDVLSPGNKVTTVDLPEYGRIMVGICYDVRFPEPATIAARAGCFALVYPGAFNLTTGPLHWKLLAQGRALDNQVYVAMCSPARDMSGPYHAYGHSMIVDPLAQVVAEAGEGEDIIEWELDGARIDEVRRNIPLATQRRFDVYPDVSRGDVRYEEPGAPGKSS